MPGCRGLNSVILREVTMAYPAFLRGSLKALSSINQLAAGGGKGESFMLGKGFRNY